LGEQHPAETRHSNEPTPFTERTATKTKELKMSNTPNQTQTPSGSVDPMAQAIVDVTCKLGGRAWLGFPPPEEMERLKAEKAGRDFQAMKRRADARERRREEMKRGAMEALKRSKSI
jgi:hypothetical protein